MATQLFKDGQSAWVDTSRVKAHLEAGWSADDPDTPVFHPAVIYPAGLNLEALPVEQAEEEILKHMGIVDDQSFIGEAVATPEELAQTHVAVDVGMKIEAPRQKRKYTRRAK